MTKELKVVIEISVEVEDDKDLEEKYDNLINELDNCGYDNGFGFKVVSRKVKKLGGRNGVRYAI